MPVLCVLSSDGLLFMYHIENQLTDYKNICKQPTEISDNILTQLFTTSSKIVSYQFLKIKKSYFVVLLLIQQFFKFNL